MSKRTHGESNRGNPTPEYAAWAAMKQRCTNRNAPPFIHYGARGISVCERWMNSFEAFLADVGRRPSPKHSIDRIDNDGDYEPGNVRWATRKEQRANTGHRQRTKIVVLPALAKLRVPL